jgi:hypothetical protein
MTYNIIWAIAIILRPTSTVRPTLTFHILFFYYETTCTVETKSFIIDFCEVLYIRQKHMAVIGNSCFWLAQTIYPHDLLVSVDTVCTVLHRNSSSRMDPIKQCLSWRISVSDCLTFENSSPSFKNTDPIDVLHSNASAKFLNLSRDGHSCF